MSSKATTPSPEAKKSDDLGLQLAAAQSLILALQDKLQVSEHQAQILQATVAELQDKLQVSEHQAQILQATVAELRDKLQASEHQAQTLQVTVAVLQDSLRAQQAESQKHEATGHDTHLRIASAHPAGKHMRAGREWLRAPSVVPKDDFTPEQIKQLKADGNLVVVEL